MKKQLSMLALFCVVLLLLFSQGAAAFAADSDDAVCLTTNGDHADLSETGVSYADLGLSFYARVSLPEPELYMTIPDNVMNTTRLRDYEESGKQIWHFTRQPDGSYKVRNVYANLYLELYNNDARENNEMFHSDPNDLPDQRWLLRKAGNGYQFVTCCNHSFLLKGVNLYGHDPFIIISQDSYLESTHFLITKLPIHSDYLATPAVSLSNIVGGVSVRWNPVTYAKTYRVYRYNDSAKQWVALKTTSDTMFEDKTVVSGKTYKYTVKCASPLTSKFTSHSITYIAAPTAKVNNTAAGPTISWAKVPGAQAYRVFYKNPGSSWKTLSNTKSTAFTHTGAVFNRTYYYTVRCMTADFKGYASAYDAAGVQNRIVQTPRVKAALEPTGYQLNWNRIPGAYRYIVMFKSKATNGAWKKASVCSNNSYFFGQAQDNQEYYFTVRCVDENNHYISGYTQSGKYTYYSAPRVSAFSRSNSAVRLAWSRISGAAKYRIFSWNGQKWVKRADTANISATMPITGTTEQNTCFAVRCMNKDGKYISSFYETVLSDGQILSYHSGGYTSSHKF